MILKEIVRNLKKLTHPNGYANLILTKLKFEFSAESDSVTKFRLVFLAEFANLT